MAEQAGPEGFAQSRPVSNGNWVPGARVLGAEGPTAQRLPALPTTPPTAGKGQTSRSTGKSTRSAIFAWPWSSGPWALSKRDGGGVRRESLSMQVARTNKGRSLLSRWILALLETLYLPPGARASSPAAPGLDCRLTCPPAEKLRHT